MKDGRAAQARSLYHIRLECPAGGITVALSVRRLCEEPTRPAESLASIGLRRAGCFATFSAKGRDACYRRCGPHGSPWRAVNKQQLQPSDELNLEAPARTISSCTMA